jgi:hypothetical protein
MAMEATAIIKQPTGSLSVPLVSQDAFARTGGAVAGGFNEKEGSGGPGVNSGTPSITDWGRPDFSNSSLTTSAIDCRNDYGSEGAFSASNTPLIR